MFTMLAMSTSPARLSDFLLLIWYDGATDKLLYRPALKFVLYYIIFIHSFLPDLPRNELN